MANNVRLAKIYSRWQDHGGGDAAGLNTMVDLINELVDAVNGIDAGGGGGIGSSGTLTVLLNEGGELQERTILLA